jgi:NADH-quinone oxidoreductase subunit J
MSSVLWTTLTTPGCIFFIVMSALALAGAIVTVGSHNPIRSAVGLLITIVGIAGLFVKLNAEFMAVIQLIVYAGAVVVLFVFVIMLLGPDATAVPSGMPKARLSRIVGGLVMLLVSVAGAAVYLLPKPRPTRMPPAPPEYGTVEVVGRDLFTRAIVPFELATALLIVAVVGAIAVARSRQRTKKRVTEVSPASMFVGPLIPRDAQRPLTKERA